MPVVALAEASDGALMEKIARGERDAFVRLFERYAPTAMALAHRILRRRHLAEEAVQEAFLAVWRDPDRYEAVRGAVRSWLMSTAHNKSVDLVRRETSQRARAAEAMREGVTDELAADPADVVVTKAIKADEATAVRLALASLPPG